MRKPASIFALALFCSICISLSLTALAQEREVSTLDTRIRVDGAPPLGTYVARKVEDLRLMSKIGMNVVIGDEEHLDPGSPEGAFCEENGIKVLYHLTRHIYGAPRLQEAITAEQTMIPLSAAHRGALPATGGVVVIEDELVRFGQFTAEGLVDCVRGVNDTEPAPHHEGIILFNPQACADDVAAVKDSPNLWGYYVLDDSPGDALSALKATYRLIREVDGPDRIVAAGYGSEGSLMNFDKDVCDLMLIYWYPITTTSYDRFMISRNVQWMLTTARARVPGVPFAGVFQTFWGDDTGPEPTTQQVREQMEDFVREGACGLVAFTCKLGSKHHGWSDSVPIQRALHEAHEEIQKEGGLHIVDEPEDMAKARIQPKGLWDTPQKIAGLVPAWYVIGPFDDPDQGYLAAKHPPEKDWSVEEVHQGKFGSARWVVRETQSGVLGLGELHGHQTLVKDTAMYAQCTVANPTERAAIMQLGRDDDLLVWLGDEEVARFEGSNGLVRDQFSVPVTLSAGTTTIRVKSCNREGMWGFAMRFTDPSGCPLDGLTFSLRE